MIQIYLFVETNIGCRSPCGNSVMLYKLYLYYLNVTVNVKKILRALDSMHTCPKRNKKKSLAQFPYFRRFCSQYMIKQQYIERFKYLFLSLQCQKDPQLVDKIMKDLDSNKDNEVDFNEFVVLVAALTVACNDFFEEQMRKKGEQKWQVAHVVYLFVGHFLH